MKVEVQKTGDLTRIAKITVPKDKVNKEFSLFCDDIRDKVDIAGFRKGHATNEAIQLKYGDLSKAEVSGRLVYEGVLDLMSNHGLTIAGSPMVSEQDRATDKRKWVGNFKIDGSFECSVSFEVPPDIDIKDYKGVAISEKYQDLNEWISNKLLDFSYTFAERLNITERATQYGDEITFDLEVMENNHSLDDLRIDLQTITLGHSNLSKELEELLLNRPLKDEFTFDIEHPSESTDGRVAGKKLSYKCFIHNITEIKTHPVDEDLAKQAGFDNLDAMRENLRELGQREVIAPLRAKLFSEITDHLIKNNEFEVPQSWISAETALIFKRMGFTEIPDDAAMRQAVSDIATRVVKQNFMLDKIYIKEEGIHLSADDVQNIMVSEGTKVGKSAEQMLTFLKQTNQYEGFIGFFEHQRTIDFLLTNAVMKERSDGN